jgi:hypothetical protein
MNNKSLSKTSTFNVLTPLPPSLLRIEGGERVVNY